MSRSIRWSFLASLALLASTVANATDLKAGHVSLICHRTANKDVPENTLESLEQAALLGCDMVEVDVRRTLDGQLVLNHDGFLERLTDGIGDIEQTYYEDLTLLDAGGWMGDRFRNMKIPLFEDAVRLARRMDICLYLDLKDSGMGADVLQVLEREGMLERVRFGGEWSDVKQLDPRANEDDAAGAEPGVTAEQVAAYHLKDKAVIANFSANGHEMDLAAMKAAVSAGVDGINVDYPRLGADAVGRPVERKISELVTRANSGDSSARVRAILSLSHYRGFNLQDDFVHWLSDPDDHVSRAAALALVTARPQAPVAAFADALHSKNADARANAAWALGATEAPAATVLGLIQDSDPRVQEEALVALAHMPGDVSAGELMPLLSSPTPAIRGDAALALAKHQPLVAAQAVPAQLKSELRDVLALYDAWVRRGKTPLTDAEKDEIVRYYRCQAKEVLAISMLHSSSATAALAEQAFRSGKDFAEMNEILSAFNLWDRIGAEPAPAIEALGSADVQVADRAEWVLINGGPSVLPEVRRVLQSGNSEVQAHAIRILAWQGDTKALSILRTMQWRDPELAKLATWAAEKIDQLHPSL